GRHRRRRQGGDPLMPVLVASDLDRTLIYSAAALALTMPDARAPRLLCVEVHESKPLCYMTETAAGLLTELGDSAVFVPTTTRTRKQYQRINLPGPAPAYAICANGGHLLVDGVSDPDWHARVTARLAAECAPLAQVQEHLLRTADPVWLRKHRVAEDLFAYLVVEIGRASCREGEWSRDGPPSASRRRHTRFSRDWSSDVCSSDLNGGHLLVDGVSDPDWHARVTARLAAECAPLAQVQEHLLRTADPVWLRKHRVAEDLFAYLVV